MEITALDGRGIEVRRRWFPWRPRLRRIDPQWIDLTGGADDPISAIALLLLGLVAGVVLAVALTIALLASEILLVLIVLIPLVALARFFWLLPWKIEAVHGNEVLGSTGVRGWRDSQEKIREVAAAYQCGEDPFRTPETHPGLGYTVG